MDLFHMAAKSLTLRLAVSFLVLTGCGQLSLDDFAPEELQKEEEQLQGGMEMDPTVAMLRTLEETFSAATAFDVEIPKPPGAPAGETGSTLPKFLEGCSATPNIQKSMACGVTYPTSASVTWQACVAKPPQGEQPPMSPAAQRGPGGQMPQPPETSGSISTTMSITDSAGCDPQTEVALTRQTTFSIATKVSDATTTTAGTVHASATQALGTMTYTRTLTLDLTNSVAKGNEPEKNNTLQGDLTLGMAGSPGQAPTRTVNGSLAVAGEKTEQFSFKDIVSTMGSCRHPTSGEVTRVDAEGKEHKLVLGPDCGKATLDGKAISLEPQMPQQQQPPQ